VESEPIHIRALKSNQQRPEFVTPSKGSFNDEPLLLYLSNETSFASALYMFPIPFVLWNSGTYSPIPQHLPRFSCIKPTICIEEGTAILQVIPIQICKNLADCSFQFIAIIMATSNNLACPNNIAIPIDHWNNIAGLRFLSPLILDTFAPFFATVWLPSRLRTDKFNSYLIEIIPASNKR
jgi:hypothetical protein